MTTTMISAGNAIAREQDIGRTFERPCGRARRRRAGSATNSDA